MFLQFLPIIFYRLLKINSVIRNDVFRYRSSS